MIVPAVQNHESLAQVFRALADPTRLRILRLLAANRTEMCVCELVDCLQERQYNVSRQLKALLGVGVITAEKEGRWVYYGLDSRAGDVAVQVHRMIARIDIDTTLAHDQKRFERRMRLRSGGRCRVGIQSPGLDA